MQKQSSQRRICESDGTDRTVWWLVLTLLPVALLVVAEYLPRRMRPLNPTYLKYFATQTLLVATVLMLLWRYRPCQSGMAPTTYLFPALVVAYAGWGLLSQWWAAWPYGAGGYLLHETTFYILAVLFFMAVNSRKRWRQFAVVFCVSVTVAALWQMGGIMREVFEGGRGALAGIFRGRAFLFGNVNFSCSTVITAALLSVGLALGMWSRNDDSEGQGGWRRGLAYGTCAAALLTNAAILVLARSLAGYIAAGVACAVYLVCMMPGSRLRRAVGAGLLGTFLVTIFVVLYVPQYRHSMLERVLEPGTTTRARVVWWTATADMFTERPVRGWGVGAYGSKYYRFCPPIADEAPPTRNVAATHPHNEYLRLGAELGAVGLFLYCLMLTAALVASYRAFRHAVFPLRATGYAAWAGLVAYVIQAGLGKGIQAWDMALPFWILLGSLAATAKWNDRTEEKRSWGSCRRLIGVAIAGSGLLFWWWVAGVGGYRSMLYLNGAHARVNGFAEYATRYRDRADDPRVAQLSRRIGRGLHSVISRGEPQCPVPTVPLRLRYSLGVNLASLGLHEEAMEQFLLVEREAPGFQRLDLMLADQHLRNGEERKARDYFVQYLQYHPSRTGAYVKLARLDLEKAADMLAGQVLARDKLTDPSRTALLGRMLAGMGEWNGVRRLLYETRERGHEEVLTELGAELRAFCESFGREGILGRLREDFPEAFGEEPGND
ncbi:MAG: O-antigen ligase family protein [Candidatus Brocadiia bacterium]